MTQPINKFILASGSPRRRELLKEIVTEFQVVISNEPEQDIEGLTPEENAKRHALNKAKAISGKHPDAVVIGADTIVVLEGRILGKPSDLESAQLMLHNLSNKAHQVITGIAVICKTKNLAIVDSDTTEVIMKKLSPTLIQDYLKKVNTLDKAGAYGIQEEPKIVESIQGSYSNVVGLPLEKLRTILSSHFSLPPQ